MLCRLWKEKHDLSFLHIFCSLLESQSIRKENSDRWIKYHVTVCFLSERKKNVQFRTVLKFNLRCPWRVCPRTKWMAWYKWLNPARFTTKTRIYIIQMMWIIYQSIKISNFYWCVNVEVTYLSLIHIWRCRRYAVCRSRWSPYH